MILPLWLFARAHPCTAASSLISDVIVNHKLFLQEYSRAWEEYDRVEEAYYRAAYEQWMREHPVEMTDLLQEKLH
jgi:hypothetical protein